ncbi:MAG: GNAT family N-acetyltransferase [Tepidisphaeraceae bacterium]
MSDLTTTTPALPLPPVAITVRAGTLNDVQFMDGLQKLHTKQVGWMPTKTLEGKIRLGHVLIAVDASGERVGYCIGNDQYFKRDDVGIIYQMNVAPGRQRGLVGATLLKAQFERSAYGCKLYCCWCAQDIAANQFWEAMGFVPLAFRTGSASKGPKGSCRTHIFWQRRIRAGDTSTPWWFPSQTTGGSIREDRLVLPIPPDTHWSEAKPTVLPGMSQTDVVPVQRRLPGRATSTANPKAGTTPKHRVLSVGGMRFAAPKPIGVVKEKPKREPRQKQKNDPKLVAAARELRDRWLERMNGAPPTMTAGKYDVSRALASDVTIEVGRPALAGGTMPLLSAA